jgi:glycosyltransferase involved in cell wall biosynthesis
MNEDNDPIVSIGLPIYNGEKFLKEKLESIFDQTLKNYELIISDNNSSDNTKKICEEFLKKDSRIKYFHQINNEGPFANFNFVLKKSTRKFFVWTAVDDMWENSFLEKTINELMQNNYAVGCTSQVERIGKIINEFEELQDDSWLGKKYKRIRRNYRKFGTISVSGSWHKKAETYMKTQSGQAVYSVFRTNELKKSFQNLPPYAIDMALIMSVLKYGDIISIKETLWYYHTEGISSESIRSKLKTKKITLTELFTSPSSFVKWTMQKFGIKFVLKNIMFFIFLYTIYPTNILIEILLNRKNN